jgi:hypothetical protein
MSPGGLFSVGTGDSEGTGASDGLGDPVGVGASVVLGTPVDLVLDAAELVPPPQAASRIEAARAIGARERAALRIGFLLRVVAVDQL